MCQGIHYHVTQNEITGVLVKQLTRDKIFLYLCSMGWVTILVQSALQHPLELVEFNQMKEGPREYLPVGCLKTKQHPTCEPILQQLTML